MTSFPTPYQMFEEYMDQEAQKRFNLEKIMHEYARKAENRIGEYVDCISEAYLNGFEKAAKIFKEERLNVLHALAILDDMDGFEEEYAQNKYI